MGATGVSLNRLLWSFPQVGDTPRHEICLVIWVTADCRLWLEERDGGWALQFMLVDEYLACLRDRNYSPKTLRSYGYDLLVYCRWLLIPGHPLTQVSRRCCFVSCVPAAMLRSQDRAGSNVIRLWRNRSDQYPATTINRRPAAIS
jgi:integrase/recombinase XerD